MMEREEREKLEEELLQYPIMQFAYLKTEKISFLQRVREVCKNECPRYGTSCPARPLWGQWQSAGSDARPIRMYLYFLPLRK